jgi:uncharacterized protein
MKKIIITGATGSIGKKLVQELTARGDEVIIFTRNPENAKKKIVNANKYVKWDYERMDAPSSLHYAGTSWMHEMHGVDVVVHLAGRTSVQRDGMKNIKNLLMTAALSAQEI